MKRTGLLLTLALTVGIALGVIGTQALNAQQAPMKRTVLIKTDLAGIEGKEAVLAWWSLHLERLSSPTITLEKSWPTSLKARLASKPRESRPSLSSPAIRSISHRNRCIV